MVAGGSQDGDEFLRGHICECWRGDDGRKMLFDAMFSGFANGLYGLAPFTSIARRHVERAS